MAETRFRYNEYGVLEWLTPRLNITAGAPTLDVTHWRFRDDNISSPDSTPTWLDSAEDGNPTSARAPGTGNSFVIRVQVDESNNKTGSWTLTLNYNYNSGTASGSVTNASSYARLYNATSRGGITDDTAVTVSRLTSATGTFQNGTCTTGQTDETIGVTIGSNGAWTEVEWVVYLVDGQVANNDTVQFSVTGHNGTGGTLGTVTALVTATTYYETLPASGVGTAAFGPKTVFKYPAAAATGTAAFVKSVSKTLAASGIGTAALTPAKKVLQSLAATAVGTAVISTVKTAYKTLAATATGTAVVGTNKIVDPGLDYVSSTENTLRQSTADGDVTWSTTETGTLLSGVPYLVCVTGWHGQDSTQPLDNIWIYGSNHGNFTESDAAPRCYSGAGQGATYKWFTIHTPAANETLVLKTNSYSSGNNVLINHWTIMCIPLDHVTVNQDYYFAENTTPDTPTTNWKDHASLTFTPGTAGHNWLILPYCLIDSDTTTNQDVRMQTVWSGGITSSDPYISKETNNLYMRLPFGVPQIRNLAASSHTVKIQFQQEITGTGDGSCTYSSIIALDLDTVFDKYAFEQNIGDDITSVSTTSFGTNAATCSLTPNTAGEDVYVLAAWIMDCGTAGIYSKGRIQMDNSDINTGATSNAYDYDRTDGATEESDKVFGGIVTSVSAASHTFDLDCSVSSGTDSDADDTMILAISLIPASTVTTTYKTIAATAIGTAAFATSKIVPTTIAATAVGTAAFSTVAQYYRTLGASGVGTAALSTIRTAVEALIASATGTPVITAATTYLETLASTGIGTAAFSLMHPRTLEASGVGTADLSSTKTIVQSIPAAAVGTPGLSTVSTWYRTLAASGIGTPALDPAWLTFVTLNAGAVGTAAVTPLATYYRTLAASGTGTSTLAAKKLLLQTLNATAIGTAALDPLQIAGVTMDASATGTADLTKIIGKLVAAAGVGTPTIDSIAVYPVTIAAGAVGTALMLQSFQTAVTMAASAIGTAALSRVQLILVNIPASAVGTAALSTIKTGIQLLSASATGTAAFGPKTVSKTLATTATGTSLFVKSISKTLAATATGTAALIPSWLTRVTMNATAVAAAVMGTLFIPGGPPPVQPDKSRRGSVTRFGSSLRFRRN